MRKIVLVSLAAVIVTCFMANGVWADMIKLADIPEKIIEKWVCIDKEKGTTRNEAAYTTEIGMQDGKKFVCYTEEGNGLIEGAMVPGKWKLVAYGYANPYLLPHYSKREVFSKEGKLLRSEVFQYDQKDKKIYITYEDKDKNTISNKTAKFENDEMGQMLNTALYSFDFKGKKDMKIHMTDKDGSTYSITMVHRGMEEITVPAGTYNCHKIEVTVNLGLLNVVTFFFPKTYMWFSDTEPAQFIQYTGLETGPGTPVVLSKLIERKEIKKELTGE